MLVKHTYASAAALIPWEHAQGSQRGDSDKQLTWHIWHTKQCLVKQLHKTRWNRLMENSSRSRLSRNDTLPAFVSTPLWSVCVKAGSYDSHVVSVPSGSSSAARHLTRAWPSASTRFRNIKQLLAVPLERYAFLVFLSFHVKHPLLVQSLLFNDLWIVYATFAKWMNLSCSINNEAQSASRMNLPNKTTTWDFE